MRKINGRFLTDAELYPEQFEDLPEDAVPKERVHAVKLGDIDSGDSEERGKSRGNRSSEPKASSTKKGTDLNSLLGSTVPDWKKGKGVKDAVNRGKTVTDDVGDTEDISETYGKKRRATARAYAMKIVAMGAVTERKLTEKLHLRDYSEEEIEEAVNYVKSFGYVNDGRLAQDMVEKLAARMWGRFKISYYLKGKGIPEEVIEELDFSQVDFPYYCAKLMKKYTPERRDAMLRAVKNAGYTSEDVRAARRLLADEE